MEVLGTTKPPSLTSVLLVLMLRKPKQEILLLVHGSTLIARGKGYFSSRISYHSNSVSSFHLIRLFISGDVCLNPGPDKCEICRRTIARNHRTLSCDVCNRSFHIKCQAFTPQYIRRLTRTNWTCNICFSNLLPFVNNSFANSLNDSGSKNDHETGEDSIEWYEASINSYYKYTTLNWLTLTSMVYTTN